jgi:Flp pilus assembly protein TadD
VENAFKWQPWVVGITVLLSVSIGGAAETTSSHSASTAKDYFNQITMLARDNKYKEAVAVAQKWEAIAPNDPDLAVAKANLTVTAPEAQPSIVINAYPDGTAQAPENVRKPIQVIDNETSEPAGYIGEAVPAERNFAINKAVDILTGAVEKHPDRLDIRMGISQLHAINENYEAILKNLTETLRYAASKKYEGLLWAQGKAADQPEKALSNSVHHYYSQYTRGTENPEDALAFKFAELGAKYFPKDIRSWNNISAEYVQRDDLANSVGALMKAHELDPSDTIVLMNIGHLYDLMEKPAEAIKFYQKVVDMKDPDHAEAARQEIKELKSGKSQRDGATQ